MGNGCCTSLIVIFFFSQVIISVCPNNCFMKDSILECVIVTSQLSKVKELVTEILNRFCPNFYFS